MSPCLLLVVTAYIGPGAGLGLIGALIAVVSAVMAALFFVVLWPVRMLLRKAKMTGHETTSATHENGTTR
jgi:hypothetical protein